MRQIDADEAITIHDSEQWKEWTNEQVVAFQLFQERLAVPWSVFQLAMDDVLGRPTWTHEYTDVDKLKTEYLSLRSDNAPTRR